jgi:acetate kinase
MPLSLKQPKGHREVAREVGREVGRWIALHGLADTGTISVLAEEWLADILTINAGSSSLKCATYSTDPFERISFESIDRAGESAAPAIDWLDRRFGLASIAAVGHRIVHGMDYSEPMRITQSVLDELHRIGPYDPEHLPQVIALIEEIRSRFPELPQIACFDTAFHRDLPRVARILPIPRRFEAMGVRRYGFHGLSFAYLMRELAQLPGPQGLENAARGRVILAHLGNGASLAAIRDGKCIDTTMGFTPAGGLPMGTRSGDLDPGVAWFMTTAGGLSPGRFHDVVNHESGLLGISETSADMRVLENLEKAGDIRAAEAIEMFCYQTRKWIGSYAAALAGIDTLVFSGGIGENSSRTRARICDGLQFLGVEIGQSRNSSHAAMISTGRVQVRVIRTDEEFMIARHVRELLKIEKQPKEPCRV